MVHLSTNMTGYSNQIKSHSTPNVDGRLKANEAGTDCTSTPSTRTAYPALRTGKPGTDSDKIATRAALVPSLARTQDEHP